MGAGTPGAGGSVLRHDVEDERATGALGQQRADELLEGRVPGVEVPRVVDDGFPDGIAIDAADHLWIAVWGTGQVRRYASRFARRWS